MTDQNAASSYTKISNYENMHIHIYIYTCVFVCAGVSEK